MEEDYFRWETSVSEQLKVSEIEPTLEFVNSSVNCVFWIEQNGCVRMGLIYRSKVCVYTLHQPLVDDDLSPTHNRTNLFIKLQQETDWPTTTTTTGESIQYQVSKQVHFSQRRSIESLCVFRWYSRRHTSVFCFTMTGLATCMYLSVCVVIYCICLCN